MENKNFSDIGKIEAIRLLFEESHFKQADGTAYLCGEKGSVVRTASRIWLEGIDFDLTYFPGERIVERYLHSSRRASNQ